MSIFSYFGAGGVVGGGVRGGAGGVVGGGELRALGRCGAFGWIGEAEAVGEEWGLGGVARVQGDVLHRLGGIDQ